MLHLFWQFHIFHKIKIFIVFNPCPHENLLATFNSKFIEDFTFWGMEKHKTFCNDQLVAGIVMGILIMVFEYFYSKFHTKFQKTGNNFFKLDI